MGPSRQLYSVIVEPSAVDLTRQDNSAVADGKLPSLFAFSYNFKPDSAADSTRGALFVPEHNYTVAAEYQLELSSTRDSGASSKTAHVFSGRQLPSKMVDLVLVWDHETNAYRLDRLASSFAFKAERSRTAPSREASQAWTADADSPKRRKIEVKQAKHVGQPYEQGSGTSTSKRPTGTVTNSSTLRSRSGKTVDATVVRGRSSNRVQSAVKASAPYRPGLRVEAEVFEDILESPRILTEPVAEVGKVTETSETKSDPDLEDELATQLQAELDKTLQSVDVPQESPDIRMTASTPSSRSPHFRLKRLARLEQANTPKAHSPEPSDLNTATSNFRTQSSQETTTAAASDQPAVPSAASVGLGLIHTGADDDEDDDDLDDFAAELDLSLAQEPQTAVFDNRRTTPHGSTTTSKLTMSNNDRRIYGLGGPRPDEQDLEDSD